jgi:hypothetical protein
MTRQLAILMATVGCILVIAPLLFFSTPEVRQWFPIFLVSGILLAWFGIQKYRNA